MRLPRRALVAVLLPVAVLAGCSKEAKDVVGAVAEAPAKISAKRALDRVAGGLGDERELTFRLHLDGDLASLAAASGDDAATARQVGSAALVVVARAAEGRTLGEAGEAVDVGLRAELDGTALVDLRVLDGTPFVHVDAPAIAELLDADLAAFRADAASELADSPLSFVLDAIDGRWLTLDADALAEELGGEGLGGFGGFGGSGGGIPDLGGLRDLFDRNLTITRETDGDVERFAVSAPAERLLRELVSELEGLLPGELLAEVERGLDDLPAELRGGKRLRVDLEARDGLLREVRFDLGQVVPELSSGDVAIVLDVEPTAGAIDRPSDAVTVDVAEILESFLGGMFGDTGPDGSALDAAA